MKIGYARVSTQDQNLELQLKALKSAGCQRIFREKVSGATRNRPEFQRMLDQIRSGDSIVVWRLDRLARSTRDLLNTMEALGDAGAKFQSLSEPWANTTTHAGKMIMTVFAGIAEFERDLIRERTAAGRSEAKMRGVRFGRPRKLNSVQVRVARDLLNAGKSIREIAKTFTVHEATIYRLFGADEAALLANAGRGSVPVDQSESGQRRRRQPQPHQDRPNRIPKSSARRNAKTSPTS